MQQRRARLGASVVFIRLKTDQGIPNCVVLRGGVGPATLVNHNNSTDRMASCRRRFIQISALSTVDGRIEAYHGGNG